MSKKQIKELIIQTTSKGTKEAVNEVTALNEVLKSSAKSALALTGAMRESAKNANSVATAYASVSKAIDNSLDSVKKLNTALNGDSKKASKSLSAYLDNLELLNLGLMNTASNAGKAASALGSMATAAQLDDVLGALVHLDKNLDAILGTSQETVEAIKEGFSGLKTELIGIGDIMERTEDNVTTTNERIHSLGKTVETTGQRAGTAAKDTDKFNNSVRRLGEAGSSSARSFSKLAFGMNPLVSAYAAIAVNIYAVSEAFRVLKEAAALERLEEQTANFAASVSGVNVKGLARDLQMLAGGALDSAEALKQAVRGVSFGFSPEMLRELTEGARKASVALGRDFTDSLDRVLRGISKGEVELLDELGVVTRLETAFKNYARTTGLEADKLTDSQRKLALAQEVNLQLTEKYKSFSTAASEMERLGTATKDASNALLKNLAKSLEPAAGSLAGWIEGLRYTNEAQKRAAESYEVYQKALAQGKQYQASVALAEYTEQLELAYSQTKEFIEINGERFVNPDYAKNIALISAQQEKLESLKQAIGAATVALSIFAAVKLAPLLAAIPAVIAGFKTLAVVLTTTQVVATGLALPFVAAAAPMWAIVTAIAALATGVFVASAAITTFVKSIITGKSFTEEFGEVVDGAQSLIGDLLESLGESVTGLVDFSKAAEDAKHPTMAMVLATREYNEALKQGNVIAAGRAKAAMQYLKDSKDSATAAADVAKQMRVQKTDAETLYGALAQLSNVNLDVLANPEGFKELETTFENLKTNGVISRDLAFENGKGFAAAAEGARILAKEYKVISEAALEYVAHAQAMNKGMQGEEALDNAIELKAVQDQLNTLKRLEGTISKDVYSQIEKDLISRRKLLETIGKQLDIEYAREASLRNISILNAKIASDMEIAGASESQKLIAEREALMRERKAMGNQDTTGIDVEIAKLEIDIKRQKILEDRQAKRLELETAQQIEMDNLQAIGRTEEEILKTRINQAKAALEMPGITAAERKERLAALSVLENQLRIAKEQAANENTLFMVSQRLAEQERLTNIAGSNTSKLQSLLEEIKIKRELINTNSKLNATEKAEQLAVLGKEEKRLKSQDSSAKWGDASNVMGSIAGFEGLTDLQSTFAGTMSSLSGTYSQFLSDMDGQSGSFMDYLSDNTDALANVLSSSLSMAQAAFAEISKGKIASIDAEIAAEKRRDGKSEESMAKIKKLQAQKIKEEAKANKATVGMATATGIMQIWAGPLGKFPPAAIAMSAGLAAMGMMQLSNIDKAANGQLAALNGASGNLSISGGNRANEIDVSRRANAGELAYLQGAKGTGTAGNFTPGKAIGGYSAAGTSIVVGESGPEVITPAVPVNVTPAGQAGSSVQITLSPVFNTSTIDSSGFEQLTQRFSRELYDGLERELRARNRTLDNL